MGGLKKSVAGGVERSVVELDRRVFLFLFFFFYNDIEQRFFLSLCVRVDNGEENLWEQDFR